MRVGHIFLRSRGARAWTGVGPGDLLSGADSQLPIGDDVRAAGETADDGSLSIVSELAHALQPRRAAAINRQHAVVAIVQERRKGNADAPDGGQRDRSRYRHSGL